MSIELTFNSNFSADLVEKVPLGDASCLFRFEPHYSEFLKRAGEAGVNEAYIHYSVSKKGRNAGMVIIRGVSLNPRDICEGRAFDGIGSGAVKHAEQRYDNIRQLSGYSGDLYTVIFSPISDEVIADSRK